MNATTTTLIRLLYVAAAIIALVAAAVECAHQPPVPHAVAISTSGGERPDVETLLYRLERLEERTDGTEDAVNALLWLEEDQRYPRCTPTPAHQTKRDAQKR